MSSETKQEIILLWEGGDVTQREIAKTYGVSAATICHIINSEKHSTKKEEKLNEETNIIGETIEFAGRQMTDNRLTKLSNSVSAGMIANRHVIGTLSFIFDDVPSDRIFDYRWQENIVREFISKNFEKDANGRHTKFLNLYCTGLQTVLASIMKVCHEEQLNLTLNHWDSVEKEYVPQKLITEFGDFEEIKHPFSSLEKKGSVYLYNCKLEDIIGTNSCFAVSLSHFEGSEKDSTINILTRTSEEAWRLYILFQDIAQSNPESRSAVLLSDVMVWEDGYQFGELMSRYYNFKDSGYGNN